MRLAILDRSVSVASRRGIVAAIVVDVADAMANRSPMNRNRAAKLHRKMLSRKKLTSNY